MTARLVVEAVVVGVAFAGLLAVWMALPGSLWAWAVYVGVLLVGGGSVSWWLSRADRWAVETDEEEVQQT